MATSLCRDEIDVPATAGDLAVPGEQRASIQETMTSTTPHSRSGSDETNDRPKPKRIKLTLPRFPFKRALAAEVQHRSEHVWVELREGSEQYCYALKKTVLTDAFVWFESDLTKEIAEADPHRAEELMTKRNCDALYQLTKANGPAWILKRVAFTMIEGESEARATEQNNAPSDDVCAAYTRLFLLLAGAESPRLVGSMERTLEQGAVLAELAEFYQCLVGVGRRIEKSLLEFGTDLFKAVLNDPSRWLKISINLESGVIFKEAMIHIVGQYHNSKFLGLHKEMVVISPIVAQLMSDKRLLLMHVESLTKDELVTNNVKLNGELVILDPKRPDTFDMCSIVAHWQRWFMASLSKAKESKIIDIHGTMYRDLAKGGKRYLPQEEVLDLFTNFRVADQSIHGFAEFDARLVAETLSTMKQAAKLSVQSLVTNNSKLDPEEAGFQHLTCTKIADAELPWTINGRWPNAFSRFA